MKNLLDNPRKIIQVKYSISDVKKAIILLPEHVKPTTLSTSIENMNYYQFHSPVKGLNPGMFLELCLHELDEFRTEIHIECRPVISGQFDTYIEEGYGFVNGCINVLGKALSGQLK